MDHDKPGEVPRVSRIGGAFLYSNDSAALARWYESRLGIGPLARNEEEDAYYFEFTTPAPTRPDGVTRTVWALFQAKDPLPADRAFTINYRVPDLDAMLAHLRSRGVVVEKRQDESYGRFAWVRDPDGNRIELYQDLP